MRRRLSIGLTLSLGLLAIPAVSGTSCFVPGFELVEVTPPGTGGSTSTTSGMGGGDGGAGGLDPCSSARFPGPPASSDGGGDSVSFVVAFRSIDFGEEAVQMKDGSSRPGLGYDLDGRCTCVEPGESSCVAPADDQCDGFGGIDNSISVLFETAAAFSENFRSSYHSANAENGDWSILVRVEGYNGLANDDQVRVSLFTSSGLNENPCYTGDDRIPDWDGSDQWPVMTASLEPLMGAGGGGGGPQIGGSGTNGTYICGDEDEETKGNFSVSQPKFFDELAYVNGGILVASLPEAGLVLDGDGGAIDLTAGFLTGRLRQEAGSWFVDDGTLAGRWASRDAFVAVSSLGSGGTLCTDDTLYQTLKQAVCDAQDITSQISGPTAPCNAVSFGMAFSAEPAQLGFVYVPEPGNDTMCPPATDPANDTCD